MTRRSYEALELLEEVRGTACPVERCTAHADPDGDCVGLLTEEALRVPHWQRIRASERNRP